ncbi:CDGSH iron-sulfur domain-containing protein [Arthrobacter sp. zg-Y820]|uniref:CDGSH iron-sulfur domain-containing protein n=1 Tax=Arthrobacter sp. zg-Y820 TaxID=2894192 RepID=UPI003FA4AF86
MTSSRPDLPDPAHPAALGAAGRPGGADDCGGCPTAESPADSEPGSAGPPASVVACPNGPLLVRGNFEIVTPDGVPIPRDRETVALCRCGGSAIKPYCDGTHKLMKFDTTRRRPVPAAVVSRLNAEEEAGSKEQ